MNTMDLFKRYDSPEQYAEAFQQMIDTRERRLNIETQRWRSG